VLQELHVGQLTRQVVAGHPVNAAALVEAGRVERLADLARIGPVPMTARGIATGAGFGGPLQARIRATGQPDLLVTVNRGQPSIAAVEPAGEALIEGDPAARLLFMWGRRATPFGRLLCHGSAEELSRIQWLLSGY
jgi:hypothetical protein